MTSSDLSRILRIVEDSKNALIIGHAHPDGDCVGSAMALCEIAEALGCKATLLLPDPVPLRLAFLLGERQALNEVPEDLDAYTIITVDVASPTQLGDLKDALADKVALRIDHHDVGTPYAKAEFVDPRAAATGEIIFDLYEHAIATGKLKAPLPRALYAMFGAISSDTGCFKYANVTGGTHLRAAKLIDTGVAAAEINRLLFETKDASQLRAEGVAQRKLQLFADGKISCIAIDRGDYTDGISIGDFDTAIDIARSVRGSLCAAVIKASLTKESTYRASLRSIGLNVAAVAERFGGGGHVRAAGCSLECASIEEALRTIVAALTEAIEAEKNA